MTAPLFPQGRPMVPGDWDTYDTDPRFAYLEWLTMEARLLRLELWPHADPRKEFTPINTFAHGFHWPELGQTYADVVPPSARAEPVLRAVGIEIPGRTAA